MNTTELSEYERDIYFCLPPEGHEQLIFLLLEIMFSLRIPPQFFAFRMEGQVVVVV